jgi:KUP system potassium uptake protein
MGLLSLSGGRDPTTSTRRRAHTLPAICSLDVQPDAQRWGTARNGKFFGPVMARWFAAIALCGVADIVREPAILQALSPHWAVRYFTLTR